MTDENCLLQNEEFIEIQRLNSVKGRDRRRHSIVYDKPIPGTIDSTDDISAYKKASEEAKNLEASAKGQSKDTQDEILKKYLSNLHHIEKKRYRKGDINKVAISFFDDVDFDTRPTLFDSVVTEPFITSFQGPVIEKQMKAFEKSKKERILKAKEGTENISVEKIERIDSNFSGLYIIMWMIFGWIAFRGMIDYYIAKNGDLRNIEVLNLMLEKLDVVFGFDFFLWITSFFVVFVQYLVKWKLISWDPVGRYIVFIYEMCHIFFANYMVLYVFKLNWISRIFFFLHSMVFLMKMHSFSFFNGYMWNIHKELNFSKTNLAKFKDIATKEHIEVLERSLKFCEYEISTQSSSIKFPDNITCRNFMMFSFFPTLVYQLEYPRTNRIRWRYIVEKFSGVIGILILMILTAQLYVYPVCTRIFILRESEWPDLYTSTVEWLYLLAEIMPGLSIMFMLTFYFIWDAFLNCVAELTMFADRYFYGDWWNCVTFAEWSRLWNVPVHKFLLRHVYHSAINHFRLTSMQATLYTFALSSVLHELSMFIIFKRLRPYMFLFQMTQIPTAYVSAHAPFKGRHALCNVLFIFAIFAGISILPCLYLVY